MSSSIETGAVVLGRYLVGEQLGHGGMGSVFEATHTITGKQVALKWLLPELAKEERTRRRLLREARVAAKVAHPNTVDIYDVGTHEGAIFLVMELLRGETLGAWLRKRGAVPGEELICLLIPALRGIAALHAAGVVHRDLKPDNIFLCEAEADMLPEAKVLDFGIATATEKDAPKLTDTGAILGTPGYMAPEQLAGSGEVDERADVYSVGVILYLGLTGRRPFEAENIPALVGKVLFDDVEPVWSVNPDVSEALSSVVMRAISRDLEERHQDISELTEALYPFVPDLSAVSGSMRPIPQPSKPIAEPTPEPIPQPPQRSSAALWIGALALLAVVAAMLVPLLLESDESESAEDPTAAIAETDAPSAPEVVAPDAAVAAPEPPAPEPPPPDPVAVPEPLLDEPAAPPTRRRGHRRDHPEDAVHQEF